jgi:hypothetical protein
MSQSELSAWILQGPAAAQSASRRRMATQGYQITFPTCEVVHFTQTPRREKIARGTNGTKEAKMPFPAQESHAFTESDIEVLTPNQFGVYGIFRSDAWIYIGIGDIRASLLAHLKRGDLQDLNPTHYVGAVASPGEALLLKLELVDDLKPIRKRILKRHWNPPSGVPSGQDNAVAKFAWQQTQQAQIPGTYQHRVKYGK